jgi:hypothetical protein
MRIQKIKMTMTFWLHFGRHLFRFHSSQHRGCSTVCSLQLALQIPIDSTPKMEAISLFHQQTVGRPRLVDSDKRHKATKRPVETEAMTATRLSALSCVCDRLCVVVDGMMQS